MEATYAVHHNGIVKVTARLRGIECGERGAIISFTMRGDYADGTEVVTNDLWAQGVIPAHFRDRLPDNAEFLPL